MSILKDLKVLNNSKKTNPIDLHLKELTKLHNKILINLNKIFLIMIIILNNQDLKLHNQMFHMLLNNPKYRMLDKRY